MELIYLYHSGFALLGEEFTVVFDFYEDSESSVRGCVHDELLDRPGKFYVLSSHGHYDHFNSQVFQWKKRRSDIIYLFSKDILLAGLVQRNDVIWLEPDEEYVDEILSVRAFGSTDIGVSFFMQTEGKKIFHAGDLNNWHWMDECMEKEWRGYENAFLLELENIVKCTPTLDVVMFPVDPRLGKEYMRGPRQFVERIKTAIFVPMHFDMAYDKAAAFAPIAQANGAKMVTLIRRGQREHI